MTHEEIKCGESKNIEFKVQLPDDSKKYMKTIVAYANTSGGKIIIGVDDIMRSIVGVEPSSVFQIMDKIVNTVSDMCTPQIVPDVTFQTRYFPDNRREMYCPDRNISGTEQTVLYSKHGKREWNLYSSGGNQQTGG